MLVSSLLKVELRRKTQERVYGIVACATVDISHLKSAVENGWRAGGAAKSCIAPSRTFVGGPCRCVAQALFDLFGDTKRPATGCKCTRRGQLKRHCDIQLARSCLQLIDRFAAVLSRSCHSCARPRVTLQKSRAQIGELITSGPPQLIVQRRN